LQNAKELKHNYYVNLGIGIPTLVANYIPEGIDVEFQSEMAFLEWDHSHLKGTKIDLINAGKQTITTLPGASFDSGFSFGMIRGQHVDLTILGAMEVSENGDIANWKTGKMVVRNGRNGFSPSAENIIVAMMHVNKAENLKFLKNVAFNWCRMR
jgi:3-oxoacid CoA-transferase subunit B